MSAVCVVGAGYVGLPTAACLVHLGHEVVCTDHDVAKIERLAHGHVTVHEEELPELVDEGLRSGRLRFSTDTRSAAANADFVFLCLPTPQGADGEADLSAVEEVTRHIAPHLRPGAVVVTKSTMPVGSMARIAEILEQGDAPSDVVTAANPEFLREGLAVRDFLEPPRVVIGAVDTETARRVAELYRGVDAPVVLTDPASAEMIKYAANTYLATKVSFVNELANACDVLGADIDEVIRGLGHDQRIGFGWLAPGPGWGGPCFPKDAAAFIHTAQQAGYQLQLVGCAVDVNDGQRDRIVAKVLEGAAADHPLVGAWGLTFKANTDDIRESPAVDVIHRLERLGARVRAFDPVVDVQQAAAVGIEATSDAYAACDGADVLVVLTEWPEFRDVDLTELAGRMARPSIVDARNLLDPDAALAAGFAYRGVGRRVPR